MRRTAWPWLLALLGACGGPALRPTGVSVVLSGATAGRDEVTSALAAPLDPAVRIRVARPEPSAPPAPLALEAAVAAARADYVETADMAACAERLGPFVPIAQALARGERELAGRALAFLAACHLAAGDPEAARRTADLLGVLDLPVPSSAAEGISPAAEGLLADARAAAHAATPVPLEVRSAPEGARVSIDGRPTACATPCTSLVGPGRHVVTLMADGFDDASDVVEVTEATQLALTLAPASPATATAQWWARHEGAPETWPSLRLLQVAAGDRRLVLLSGAPAEEGLQLRAALVVDDRPPRRIERFAAAGSVADVTRDALRDLLRDAGVIPPRPLVEEPLLWILTVGGAAIAALVTGLALYEPEVRVPVGVIGRGE
ncbi:MAG: PEGA domain-containing protein [Sandaracinaceae bacterium]